MIDGLNEASIVRLPTGRRMRHPSAIINTNPHNLSQKDIAIMQLELLVDIREIMFSILCGKSLGPSGETLTGGTPDALTDRKFNADDVALTIRGAG